LIMDLKTKRKSRSGVNNNFYGKKHTPESREKMRLAHLGKPSPNKGKSSGIPAWNKGMKGVTFNTGRTHFKKGQATKEKTGKEMQCALPGCNVIKYFPLNKIVKGGQLYCSREHYWLSKKGSIPWNKGTASPITWRNVIDIRDCACGCGEQIYVTSDHQNVKYIAGHFKSQYWKGKRFSPEHVEKLSGENANNWQGGKSTPNELARKNQDYVLWRTAVFMRDDYTCQMCGVRGGKLHADHIKQFAFYPELRYAIDNGRTLCESCHKKTPTYANRSWLGKIKF
jgi:hypothetical protein